MQWSEHYQPPIQDHWQGRTDAPDHTYLFQTITLLTLTENFTNKEPGFVILGFCSDEGVRRNLGRFGAAEGPDAIRKSAAKLVLHKKIKCYDAGNIHCQRDNLESAQIALGEVVTLLLKNNLTPIILGGGHEIAFGHFLGLNSLYKDIGIINFDAHFDMRPLIDNKKGSSGTPFLQIAESQKAQKKIFSYLCLGIQESGNTPTLFSTAKTYDADFVLAEHLQTPNAANNQIKKMLSHEAVYTTLCLDVFASAYAPGVSAPQPLGLTPWQVIPYLRQIAESGKAKSYDIAEYAPRFDIDGITAKLAANLIFEILHHHKNK